MSTKRKAEDANADDESPPTRWQRLEITSLNEINDHCILEILKYLSVDELNSTIVLLNSRYRELRNHDSLNQTRTGTIVCTENSTSTSILRAFERREWDQVFTGNRTHMKVVGMERMAPVRMSPLEVDRFYEHTLPNVSSLEMSSNAVVRDDNQRVLIIDYVRVVLAMLPNLETLDLSHVRLGLDSLRFVVQQCASQTLRKVTSTASFLEVDLGGLAYHDASPENPVAELFLDDSVLFTEVPNAEELFSVEQPVEDNRRSVFMFQYCSNLERLSIKNTAWTPLGVNTDRPAVSQGMLIKMVCHHPTLRWLRSDLTEENIAMLRQEKPDITFVRE